MKDWTVAQVKAESRPGAWRVSRNLYLQVEPTADGGVAKSWVFRYMRHGKGRWHGLGSLELVTLAEARDKALAGRKMLLEGVDPIEARHAEQLQAKLASASAMTFKACAERYIASHRAGWSNGKHAAQWEATLATYAEPVIGDLPVAAVDTGMVIKILEPIWTVIPETASRVRGRIEAVLGWASARGYRTGDNPARWRNHLDKLLPARGKIAKVQHHAALPYDELPAFMVDLRAQIGTAARCLEFTILTAARTGEAIGAQWPEFDFRAKTWTVPGSRMKAGKAHVVPLSDRAIEILTTLPRLGDFVFEGARPGQPLSNTAMLMLMRRMGRGDLTTHGFRSTFRDWTAERTAYPRDVAEMALAHTIGDKVEAAYRRGDLLAKRRRLMADWSHYCTTPPRTDSAVVELHPAVRAGR
jgi:integrase